MQIDMKPKWIIDKNSPEGVRQCDVLRVEPELLNFGAGIKLAFIKYELIDKTVPFLQTIKCKNQQTFYGDYLIWVKEAFDTKEEALTALEVKRREEWEKEGY